jgi:hypothetical protein
MNKQMLIEFIKANTPNITVSQQALGKIAEHFEERKRGILTDFRENKLLKILEDPE